MAWMLRFESYAEGQVLTTKRELTMNVFDVAMKMEMDGKAYYEKLASQTELPGLQTIFSRLAEDEQKHFEVFQAMKDGKNLPNLREGSSLATTRNIFENLSAPEAAHRDVKDTLAAYRHAMDVEAKSQHFYEKAANEETDPELKEVLLKIAAEEKQHFEIMENVYHFINSPNQYLSGAEISNRE